MMSDLEIIARLQESNSVLTPVELANLLDTLTEGALSQGSLVTYFKRAFPGIPLRILLDAAGWERLGGSEFDDQKFNELMSTWIGCRDIVVDPE
jgi:hypothetical protein